MALAVTEPTTAGVAPAAVAPAVVVPAALAGAVVVPALPLLSLPQAEATVSEAARATAIVAMERVVMKGTSWGAGAGHGLDCQGAEAQQPRSKQRSAARRCQGPPEWQG